MNIGNMLNFCLLFFQNALALTRYISPSTLSTVHALAMRQYVKAQLLQAAKEPPSQRLVCDMLGCKKPKSKQKWIGCAVCGRWMHFHCANITSPPDGDYVCTVCEAQYS